MHSLQRHRQPGGRRGRARGGAARQWSVQRGLGVARRQLRLRRRSRPDGPLVEFVIELAPVRQLFAHERLEGGPMVGDAQVR